MNCVVIGSLNASILRLLVYLLFSFLVQFSIESQSQLLSSIDTPSNRLGITIYSNQSRQVLQHQ